MRPDFQLPPPANWQDFESLCWRLWKSIWNDRNAQKNGRHGQPQAGVDVFGQPDRGEDWAGVQCKGKDLYTHAKLTTAEVESEVEKAKGFKPSLSEYIIATSGPRSVETQQLARQISEQHRQHQQELFSVHVYGWKDIVDRLREYPELYEDYLKSLGLESPLRIGPPRLPRTAEHFLARKAELARLDTAWEQQGQNVLCFVAWGGVGKTALIKHWIGRMAAEQFRGAERVFEWSFYSQGTREQASSDQFIDQALKFFGDPDPKLGGPYEKGERLFSLVTRYKTLLILDGLEPLQYPPGPLGGQIKDPALDVLIKKLSLDNPGLCVVTTREVLSDIAHLRTSTAPVIELEQLSPPTGSMLLGRLGVKGTDEELQEASQSFAGHALALTLLGTYLSEVHNGDVRHWKEVPLLDPDAPQGGHARRVMQSYQKWLADSPEWSLLQLMGFFDRPAKGAEIQALLSEPPIEGITDAILKLDRPSRKRALSRLRRLRLLSEPPPDDPDGMDAHPLLREYLSEQHHPDACREGHRKLYQHLKESAKELPDTLEEMMPLYQAVAHGCSAGLYQETIEDVYRKRILRKDQRFSWKKLGAFGADLAAVSSFFERLWDKPRRQLSRISRPFLLDAVSFDLWALGRLTEAAKLMRMSLEEYESIEQRRNAARQAGSLSQLHLTLGNVAGAVDVARTGVKLADISQDAFRKMAERTVLAGALHYSGDVEQARSLFQAAEQMQKEYPLLYSLPGFRYCKLLLEECNWILQAMPAPSRIHNLSCCHQIRERAERTLEIAYKEDSSLLSFALDHLTLGRTYLLEATLIALSPELLSAARYHVNRAVTGLRKAGYQEDIPRGLIARAQFHRLQFQHTGHESSAQKAQQDLDETSLIASRGPMPLHQADIALEQSRLHHAQGHLDQARQSLSKARSLIQKHAYHRRDPEVKALEEMLEE